MAPTVSWKSFCMRPSSMGQAYGPTPVRRNGVRPRLFAQLRVDLGDRRVLLCLDPRHCAHETGLRLDDRLRVVVGEGQLGLVDLLAVGGDLTDQPAVQRLDLV